jgi:hypothetical protein
VPLDDLACGAMEVASSAVVSEAFPQPQDLLLASRGQIPDRWKSLDKAVVKRDDGRYLGLLQHDLADPNPIRISVETPREFSMVPDEPREKKTAEGLTGSR